MKNKKKPFVVLNLCEEIQRGVQLVERRKGPRKGKQFRKERQFLEEKKVA